ncbi:hypothetical protein SteCoe_27240 [Stentor coeruleus]|uniref:Uncharacterized protein n=1 Tax=Stentor coeruleus TaxID=5963 RepID=A0A1R2BB21_9CILI|nr:hypothetical protein SteCoe_27240 [Stentor coeruleus]
MNNLNLGLAIGVSGVFLNCATLYKKGGLELLVHARNRRSQITKDLSQQFKLYAVCDDAVYDFSEFLPSSTDEKL